jgi:hypothetical protein
MTGTRVLATVGFILLATAVLPPAAAWGVNRSRVRAASTEVASIAETLRRAEPTLRDVVHGAEVLCGPGRAPIANTPAAAQWLTAPRAALAPLAIVAGDRRTLAADPWGNCYIVNLAAITAGGPATLWILSAGPNGIIDTPFVSESATPAGDDVGIRTR